MPELEQINPLIKSVGTPQFDNAYFEFVNQILKVEQCTVFEYRRDSPPRRIIAIGSTHQFNEEMTSLADDYTEGGDYTKSPDIASIKENDGAELVVHSLEDIEFNDPDYYAKYYASISDELIILFGDSECLLCCGFFRCFDQAKFTQQEKEKLSKYSEIVSFFIKRHMEMQPNLSSSNRLLRDVRYHHVFDLLCKLNITKREAEICTYTVLGYTTVGIGLNLGISVNTVSTHRRRAYSKLGISSQNELFEICIDSVFDHARNVK